MILRQILRQIMWQRLLYGRRRRHRGWGAPRARTQVRVGGCCLPIPLGLVATTALGLAAERRRRRR